MGLITSRLLVGECDGNDHQADDINIVRENQIVIIEKLTEIIRFSLLTLLLLLKFVDFLLAF